MLLQKTAKAHAELAPGVRTLGLRERSVLLLADGRKTDAELRALFDGTGERIVALLLAQGYLSAEVQEPPAPAAAPAPAPARVVQTLAGARMFLFDICERLFARRDPAQADFFRQALREARDRESMLLVADEMMDEVTRIAGRERADSIRERLTALLPLHGAAAPTDA
ncbi:hypothetical protein PY257_05015 [Ramlibacter sp. H39-3-26]|uniref:hypothetical protein n=1 Tax=Curvibacter soli TaxID=3031331 RepID=UPI0023DA450F|nr:hypothetical protein [Ramlibacter sp. H39-3-26]MDF1484547.1 hypothetical protein [Ramlibacter sp. H39-3-26]